MYQSIPIEDRVINTKATLFAEELANWSPDTIRMAFREHGRESQYLPSLADIYKRCQACSQAIAYERQRNQAALPMPDHIPDVQVEINKAGVRMLRERLRKALAMPEPKKRIEKKVVPYPAERVRGMISNQRRLKDQVKLITKGELF